MTTNQAPTRAHLLVYDIPQSAKMGNPSSMLWRFGARINLSCWIVPDRNVAMLPISTWKEKGAKVELVRFDERDADTIIRLARHALLSEIGRIREALEKQTEDVRRGLEGVASGDEEGLRKASGYASIVIRRAKKAVEHAQECALTFDLLGDCGAVIDGMRDIIRAKDTLFYGWVGEAKENKRRTYSAPAPVAQQEVVL